MQSQRFKCSRCGGDLEYSPGVQSLKCPYCGTVNAMEAAAAPTTYQELDYQDALALFRQAAGSVEVQVVKCPACNGESTLAPHVTSGSCDFCGSALVASGEGRAAMEPQYVIPFAVTREQSNRLFKGWLAKRRFAPSALKRLAQRTEGLKGIYYPFWTFDSRTVSEYSGERGENYTVKVEGVDSRGERVVRNETRTNWHPASGTMRRVFDDLLVPGSRSLPPELTRRLDRWDLKQALTFQPQYLSGFKAESYSVELEEGFEEARQTMRKAIHADVVRDIGGDAQRVHAVNTHFNDVTFKYLLMPIWTAAYRFRSRMYRVLVNGSTGEVEGTRPYSAIKIILAVLLAAGIFIGAYFLYRALTAGA